MRISLTKKNIFLLVISLSSTTLLPQCSIVTQPISQLDCEKASVKFKVVASGSALTYTWFRKKPSESIFTAIPSTETNTTYPAVGEIRIANVGSAQYPDGTQFQVVVSDGSCTETSNVVTLTVNEIIEITPKITDVNKCFGTNYSYTVTTSYPANVVSYQWRKSVASGVWNSISDGTAYSGTNSATLNITGGTPAESGEYRVYITFKSSGADCNTISDSRTRKITFSPQFTTPVVTITQPTCLVNTGTIAVTVQSATDEYSFDNGFSFQTSNEKSGLAVGTYNIIIKNKAGCISPTKICQILSETSTWNGMTWLPEVPDLGRRLVFEEDFNSTSDIAACSCQIKNNAKVLVNSAHTLTVANAVEVLSGSLTFENNASLVQINDGAVNSGNINYKRHTSPVRRYDFTYWSSPVAGQTLYNLSPNTFYDKYFSYNSDASWEVEYNGATTMKSGHGYIIRAPQNFSLSNPEIDNNPMFVGVPNNGKIHLDVAGNKLCLLGNPYPSAISADAFLDTNTGVLEGTIYFWTHNSLPSTAFAGVYTYNYTANDYAMYNRSGGVGTAATTGGFKPLGEIAAAQGFFAAATATGGTVEFNNNMRISGIGNANSQFFKNATMATVEKNRIWLNLTNKEGAFKQMLIAYIAGATNGYDSAFDGMSHDANEFVDFYSINQERNWAIQGRALPFEKKDSVTLGYRSAIKGNFEISIDQTDGIFDSQKLFLEDKELQILHDLTKGAYSFSTEKGIFNSRFLLLYQDKKAVELMSELEITDDEKVLKNDVLVSVQNGKITIHSPVELINKVDLYDMAGRKINQQKKIANKVFMIRDLISSHQVFVVKTTLENGKSVIKKIIY